MTEQICTRCILSDSFPRIHFDDHGVCSVCRDYDKWTKDWVNQLPQKTSDLNKICKQAKDKKKDFDAIIPLSGGKDSTYVLYVAREKLGLKCLAYTLDFGYLSNHAKINVENTCKKLNVEHIYYRFDQDLMHKLFALFIKKTGWFCSVCMSTLSMCRAVISNLYDAPLIITGTSLRTELPLTREMFQDGRLSHIKSVLKDEPISLDCKRLLYGGSRRRKLGALLFLLSKKRSLPTYARFNLAEYVDWNYDVIYETIKTELDWRSPEESEHMDCIIHPIQKYIQARRFPGLEQERLLFARLVMAGQISREEALRKLDAPIESCPTSVLNMFLKNLGMSKEEFDKYIDMGPRHLNYNPPPDLITRLVSKAFPTRQAGTY